MKIRNSFYNWQKVDPEKEFTTEDFLYFNEGSSKIQFSPSDQMEIKKALNFDIYQEEGKGYTLYEIKNTSPYRPFTSTILYNKVNTGIKILLGENKPIYELNAEIDLLKNEEFNKFQEEKDKKTDDPAFDKIRKYIRFFFDNVSGRHGFFYFCETFEEMKEALSFHYNKIENKEELENQKEKIQRLKKENKLAKFRMVVEKHLVLPSKQGKFKMAIVKNQDPERFICTVRAFMIFRGSLFEALVHIEKTKERVLSISNEQIGIRDTQIFGNGAKNAFSEVGYEDSLPPFELF
ncbi:hypothetical protein FHS59_003495 [Algoriphagus iocasae]|uniref:Uncharacterized protein n=1 Tax=Algoriphagus iocasae TaxID=1836499 RepID=A0A841MHU6_9BACT|nr:hypothetical protein [Algoriphagus iocasae]MBB6327852.1 hypothetical protein [Algoriphagus iocasae]